MPITSPGVTITATLTDDSGVGIAGKIVCTLNNFGGVPPRVVASNVVANLVTTGQASGVGAVSVAIYGNYQIVVAGTYYEIAVYGVDANGNVSNSANSVANYVFPSTGTFDLSSLVPMGMATPNESEPVPSGAARFTAQGTSLVAGDFILTGWGSGATVTVVHGSDMAHRFTITAGTSPSSLPDVELVFHDGPWAATPVVLANMVGGTGQVSDLGIVTTAALYHLTYDGLPIATKTYTFNVICIGVLN